MFSTWNASALKSTVTVNSTVHGTDSLIWIGVSDLMALPGRSWVEGFVAIEREGTYNYLA